MKRVIEKIRLSRQTLKHDYDGSFIALENNIKKARELNVLLEKVKADKEIKHEARKHLIITSVTCMDIFLKVLAIDLIETFIYRGKDENVKRELGKYTFNLNDVLELEDESVTIGEILYATKTFYDLNEIERFFSSLVGINETKLRERIEKSGVSVNNKEAILLKDYPHYRQIIRELISMRHKLIHHGQLKRTPSLKNINTSIDNMIAYLTAMDNVMEYYWEIA
ncbi:MAG TPA: hypothetical protein VMW60_02745 [Dehalococcoidales bacterium]|nr:hypothetical protein [Dehalococcoidales bacterium]